LFYFRDLSEKEQKDAMMKDIRQAEQAFLTLYDDVKNLSNDGSVQKEQIYRNAFVDAYNKNN